MPNSFDKLREGHPVGVREGVSARLNKENKRLELSTGEYFDVSNNPKYFPKDEKQKKFYEAKEGMQQAASTPGGQFYHQLTSQGIPGGISDWKDYLTKNGENYANTKRAEHEVSQEISQESPYISGAATATNIGADIALTRGLSATKAAPLLTAGAAGSRVLSEPGEVAGEAALAAGGGFLLDKGGQWLSSAARRRGASRQLPAQQEAIRNQNLASQQLTQTANANQAQSFTQAKNFVENENAARLHQHELQVTARKNAMIQAQNAEATAKTARDAEVIRLKNQYELDKAQNSANKVRSENEFKTAENAAKAENKRLSEESKLAQKQYEEALKDLPRVQKEAQAERSKNVVQTSRELEKEFPKTSRFTSDDLEINRFIDESIDKTGLAGSKEANQAKRFLNSVFPEGEFISGKELSNRYKAIEDAIQRGSPEVQQILNEFKTHLSKRLPAILEDSIVFNKLTPFLKKNTEKEIDTILTRMGIKYSIPIAKSNVNEVFREMTPSGIVQKIQSGQLGNEIAERAFKIEDFFPGFSESEIAKLMNPGRDIHTQATSGVFLRKAETQLAEARILLAQKINNDIARQEIKLMQSANQASSRLKKGIKKTFGIAEPVEAPMAPREFEPIGMPQAPAPIGEVPPPQFPPPVQAGQTPQIPQKPTLMAQPTQPTPQTFNAIPEPTLPPAMNSAERMGDLLEKPLLTGGRSAWNNPLTRLGGLKYLTGKAGLPIASGYAALKGLTSPTIGGEIARMTFKQGGIQAVTQWAEKYPSYHDGVLENPMERRALTKEVEDAQDIPIEQKAVIQSKINRGRPLEQNL